MSRDVFISYSSVDADLVRQLVEALDQADVSYFLDKKDLRMGDIVTDEIGKGLADCAALLVVLSPASVKSQWVFFEVGQAVAFGKRVLPFMVDPSVEIPAFLKQFHFKTSVQEVTAFFTSLAAHPVPSSSGLERDVQQARKPQPLRLSLFWQGKSYTFQNVSLCPGMSWGRFVAGVCKVCHLEFRTNLSPNADRYRVFDAEHGAFIARRSQLMISHRPTSCSSTMPWFQNMEIVQNCGRSSLRCKRNSNKPVQRMANRHC